MSSKTNIVDEAARARKILARNQAWKFSAANTRKMQLSSGTDPVMGEYAVLCLVGPFGAQQYTICHPIGQTDLDDDDWIIIPTGEIPAVLSRRFDPKQQELNQLQSKYRLDGLAKAKLVHIVDQEGLYAVYYPSDRTTPRNAHLNEANARKKAEIRRLKLELSNLKGNDAVRKQELNSEIQRAGDVLDYLPEAITDQEIQIRKFLNDPLFEEKVLAKYPSTHRTLVGPYGDQKQRAVDGAGGFPLADVLGAISKKFSMMDLKLELGGKTTKSSNKRSGRNRNQKTSKGGGDKTPPNPKASATE